MKQKITFFTLVIFIISGACASIGAATKLKTERDRLSYALGLSIGQSFAEQGIDADLDKLLKGIEDAMNRRDPLMNPEEIKQTMELFRQQMTQKLQRQNEAQAGKNLAAGQKFLKQNAKKKGIITTESGLQYQIIKAGTGKTPTINDTVKTHYHGALISGKVFDSSYERGQPATFPVNGVIRGWTEALQLMKVGAKWKLFIPASLAYGERGAGNVIGPNETLIFDIELLEIQ